jgi:hypothetical protein
LPNYLAPTAQYGDWETEDRNRCSFVQY